MLPKGQQQLFSDIVFLSWPLEINCWKILYIQSPLLTHIFNSSAPKECQIQQYIPKMYGQIDIFTHMATKHIHSHRKGIICRSVRDPI